MRIPDLINDILSPYMGRTKFNVNSIKHGECTVNIYLKKEADMTSYLFSHHEKNSNQFQVNSPAISESHHLLVFVNIF